MKVYALTSIGKEVTRNGESSSEELRALQYIRSNRTATEDELDVLTDRYVVRRLKGQGLIKELTLEGSYGR